MSLSISLCLPRTRNCFWASQLVRLTAELTRFFADSTKSAIFCVPFVIYAGNCICYARHGSNELDSSSPTERHGFVMLSAAKYLSADRDRPFASLRVTWFDCSNCQVQFVQIEPCLKLLSHSPGDGVLIDTYLFGLAASIQLYSDDIYSPRPF